MFNPAKISGRWKAVLHGPDGEVKDRMPRDGEWSYNVVTTVGKEYLANFLQSATTSAASWTMIYSAIGTDATAENAADTALGTEQSRHTGTATYTSGGIYEVVATHGTNSGTGAIVEYGLLSANAAGTLLCRDTESAINKGASDTLTVTAQLTFS